MSLMFTFLCATNQAKDFTLKRTWDFQTKLVGKKELDQNGWTRPNKNILL